VFINHIYATGAELPPFGAFLCEYVTAANGVFVRAKRPGLEAMLPVCPNFGEYIRGLAEVNAYVRLERPISAAAIEWALEHAFEAMPREVLAWINWNAGSHGWRAYRPAQKVTGIMCKPADASDPVGRDAIMDFHSHHSMPPFFSATDDRDEKNGFRLYAVVGNLDAQPAILTRVGIYGHFWTIPASSVMELPEALRDLSQASEETSPAYAESEEDHGSQS
jgi:PRTRC genetic system protein A